MGHEYVCNKFFLNGDVGDPCRGLKSQFGGKRPYRGALLHVFRTALVQVQDNRPPCRVPRHHLLSRVLSIYSFFYVAQLLLGMASVHLAGAAAYLLCGIGLCYVYLHFSLNRRTASSGPSSAPVQQSRIYVGNKKLLPDNLDVSETQLQLEFRAVFSKVC